MTASTDVGGAGAARDERGVTVERAVPEAARVVVRRVAGKDELAAQIGAELVDVDTRKGDGLAGQPDRVDGLRAVANSPRREASDTRWLDRSLRRLRGPAHATCPMAQRRTPLPPA